MIGGDRLSALVALGQQQPEDQVDEDTGERCRNDGQQDIPDPCAGDRPTKMSGNAGADPANHRVRPRSSDSASIAHCITSSLHFNHFEVFFTGATIRTYPEFGYVFPAGAGRKTFCFVSRLFIVNPAANNAHPDFETVVTHSTSPSLQYG